MQQQPRLPAARVDRADERRVSRRRRRNECGSVSARDPHVGQPQPSHVRFDRVEAVFGYVDACYTGAQLSRVEQLATRSAAEVEHVNASRVRVPQQLTHDNARCEVHAEREPRPMATEGGHSYIAFHRNKVIQRCQLQRRVPLAGQLRSDAGCGEAATQSEVSRDSAHLRRIGRRTQRR
jgi:hypothetical protein